MKGLTSSEIFNTMGGIKAIQETVSTYKNEIPKWVLSSDDIYDNIRFIDKKLTDPYKGQVLDDLSNGNVKLVHNVEFLSKIPRYIVYWNQMENGKLVTYVNMTFVAKRLQSGEFTCQNMQFYMFAQFGSFVNRLTKSNFSAIVNNSNTMVFMARIYARMMTQILDRKYGLSSEGTLVNQFLYIWARYLIVSLLEKEDNERTRNLARDACNDLLTEGMINEIETNFNFSTINSIADLVDKIKQFHPRTKDLSLRVLIQDVSSMYNTYSLLAIENPTYFIFMVVSVLHLSGLHNEFRLEKILDKDGIKLYNALIGGLR